MLSSIIIVIICFIVMLLLPGSGGIKMAFSFFDIVNVLLFFLITAPMVYLNGYGKDFCNALRMCRKNNQKKFSLLEMKRSLEAVDFTRKIVIYAALMISSFHLMILLRMCDDLSALGPFISMALLCCFYLAILELLLLPLHTQIKKKLLEYMEGE